MAYCHADKVGNEGDVIKHAVLAAIVDSVLASWEEGADFHYVESHAGAAEYEVPTPRPRSWTQGVGKLLSGCSEKWPEPLHAYREAAFKNDPSGRQRVATGVPLSFDRVTQYPGSSGLVQRLARARDVPLQMTLHDVDKTVCHDLATHFENWKRIRVRREDGLLGVRGAEAPSFVFIDPPELSQCESILEIASELVVGDSAFLIWTPRSAGRFRAGWSEGRPSQAFFEATVDYGRIRTRWSDWGSQGMKGCQLTVSRRLEGVAQRTAQAVRSIMHWNEV